MLPYRVTASFASVHEPQEKGHGTIADLAAMFEALLHRVSEVEPDKDAREPVLFRGLGKLP